MRKLFFKGQWSERGPKKQRVLNGRDGNYDICSKPLLKHTLLKRKKTTTTTRRNKKNSEVLLNISRRTMYN